MSTADFTPSRALTSTASSQTAPCFLPKPNVVVDPPESTNLEFAQVGPIHWTTHSTCRMQSKTSWWPYQSSRLLVWRDRSWYCCFHDKENDGNAAAIVMGHTCHTFPLPSLEEVPQTAQTTLNANEPTWLTYVFIKIAQVANRRALSITKGRQRAGLLLLCVYFTRGQGVIALNPHVCTEYAQLSWGLQFQFILEQLKQNWITRPFNHPRLLMVSYHFYFHGNFFALEVFVLQPSKPVFFGAWQRSIGGQLWSHARSTVSRGVMYPSIKELHLQKRVWLGIHPVFGCVKKNLKPKKSIRN